MAFPKSLANSELTNRFVVKIIIPYIKQVRDEIGIPDQPASAIFDAFSGHNSEALHSLLEGNKILVVKVPAACTDELQPLDLSVNKSCKSFLRDKFSSWYSAEVEKQLSSGHQARELTVDTRMQVVKELSAQWLLGFFDYMQCKPDLFVNGFKEAGISGALDGLPQRIPSDTSSDPFDDCDSEYE